MERKRCLHYFHETAPKPSISLLKNFHRGLFAKISHFVITVMLCLNLSSCTNSMSSGTLAGAGLGGLIGGGTMVLLDAPKGLIALGALGGAGLGYYLSSMRFDASGIYAAGGQILTLGQIATIVIPTDNLFDTNSADLLPNTQPVLCSIVTVLNRFPDHNILISGNTSGFGSRCFEQKLSEERARVIAAYLWAHGINHFLSDNSINRKLIYVGYSNYFPIANDIRPACLRANSRIQITAYPSAFQLQLDDCHHVYSNIGDMREDECCKAPPVRGGTLPAPGEACREDVLPEN